MVVLATNGKKYDTPFFLLTHIFDINDYMEEWNFENWGIKYW